MTDKKAEEKKSKKTSQPAAKKEGAKDSDAVAPDARVPDAPDDRGLSAKGDQLKGVPITVQAQYLKDLSFENPNAPQSLLNLKKAPEVQVDININTRPLTDIAERTYEVSLVLRAEAKLGEMTGFITEVTYAGVFTLGQLPEDAIRPVLLVECPRILFPYARAILGEITRDGGFPPLMINPIDFADLYNQNLAASAPTAGSA